MVVVNSSTHVNSNAGDFSGLALNQTAIVANNGTAVNIWIPTYHSLEIRFA
jgi:hypothetical protein